MLVGKTEPRIWTEPLRELTPETSLGFECIDFAEKVLGMTLLPWQRWFLIHALELNEDGTFRFRRIVCGVSRQNGKTTIIRVLSAWVMWRAPDKTVLGVAQALQVAKESWTGVVDFYETVPALTSYYHRTYRASGGEQLVLTNKSRYLISAANGRAGRGLSVNLLVMDEARQQKDWSAYQALAPTTTAQPDGLTVLISNAADESGVVFNGLREIAIAGTEPGIAVFEWSAPDGCELDDADAWSQANPGLGVTVQESELRVALASLPPALFRTEHLSQRVTSDDQALDVQAWADAYDSATLEPLRDRIALCIDVAPGGEHVSLIGAAMANDGRIRVQEISSWDSVTQARKALPELVEKIKPRVLGWYPTSHAGAMATELRAISCAKEIKGTDIGTVCMEIDELIRARQIVHRNEPLLNAHVAHAQWSKSGKYFVRGASGHVTAVYAMAGAVHLARAAGKVGKPRILIAS